jgi:endonuclease G
MRGGPLALAATVLVLWMAPRIAAGAAVSETAKSNGIVECTPELMERHDPAIATQWDFPVCFEAYVSNFDTGQKLAPGGDRRFVAIPHWVVQRVDRGSEAPEARERPRTWFTVPELQSKGVAPTDASYRTTLRFRRTHYDWYERGHLAQKYLAERLNGRAGWYTHNLANAVPQRGKFNRGAWFTLECYTGAWANEFGTIWIITGPVFLADHEVKWLESDADVSAVPVAIPDAIFKIVARKDTTGDWKMLAFIYPQEDRSYAAPPWDPAQRLDTVARIEELTHQYFFPQLAENAQHLKQEVAQVLWPVRREDFDRGCRRFAPKEARDGNVR